MSGLTLGLMSMDIVELEVLRRSGSDVEARQAANIIPVVKDAHFLLASGPGPLTQLHAPCPFRRQQQSLRRTTARPLAALAQP